MKFTAFLGLLLALTFSSLGFAAQGDFMQEKAYTSAQSQQLLKALNRTTGEGTRVKRIARVIYDVAVDGGATGARGLGVKLPAGAMISRSYIYVVTQFTDTATGTVALSCEDANNLKTATDITGSAAGAFIEGASTGTAATMVAAIAADCEITATVATDAMLTGKLILFVEYNVIE